MLKHIKTYLPTYIPGALAIATIIVQAGNQYITNHPKIELGGLFGALAMAIVNHWITSPKNSAAVNAAKKEDTKNGDTSTTSST